MTTIMFTGMKADGFFSIPAHTITVDGSNSDWIGSPPDTDNLAQISRGEWIWRDASTDERTDFSDPDPRVDITELRITSDGTNMFFSIQFTDIDIASGSGSPAVSIAVDTDHVASSGQSYFPCLADTQVGNIEYYWEYNIVSSFGPGYSNPVVYDTSFTSVTTSSEIQAISTTDDIIEISVKLSTIGVTLPGSLAFTVISFRQSSDLNAYDTGESDTLDCITSTSGNTYSEVSDGDVDYSFEVYFSSNGDVSSRLLITEMYIRPDTGETEWIEISDPTGISMSLDGYRIGDEETRGGIEGMYIFPVGAFINGESIIIAVSGNAFNSQYGFYPDFEFIDSGATTPDMIKDTSWATGAVALANTEDEGIILDSCGTVIDVCIYGSGAAVFGHVR